MNLYELGILILFGLAISDLIVGVSNDAANFLNSSIGSQVTSRRIILIIASLGILAGVTFSSGMMEVARKGIFNPQFFTMPELMTIFLAVMLTDIILLDLYNTYGLPTSTTVSIVFELLGAAVAVSLLKISESGQSYGELVNYINTAKALTIIIGILLSVVVAFFVGASVQYVSRMLFTFDFERRLKRYGSTWGGAALSAIVYFILIKGAKGASFITADTVIWIGEHTLLVLLVTFVGSALFLQILLSFTRVNILRVIILVGTFALAMAFAANDLVNFIGVPLAGLSSYVLASDSGNLTGEAMTALAEPVQANTLYLLIAGGVMVTTLWVSRKARTVSKTEVTLGRQDEGFERFEATVLSQTIVRAVTGLFKNAGRLFPRWVHEATARRFDRSTARPTPDPDGDVPSFDLIRASVNLMVASALIAWATSLKLPLSTTYVTFMVAMGTSLSDQAWGRESAVYRVTGVLTVIGGWFFTAMMAFTVSSIFATAIYFGGGPMVLAIAGLAAALVFRTHHLHRKRVRDEESIEIFNLRKIRDPFAATVITFEHAGVFLREVGQVLNQGFEGLRETDRYKLKDARGGQRRIQHWSNIIAANIFKVLRLRKWVDVEDSQRYSATITTLQEISESVRDLVLRAHLHVANNHAGLLPEQVDELEQLHTTTQQILEHTWHALLAKEHPEIDVIAAKNRELRLQMEEFDQNQVVRIQRNTSKTRLSILFYSFVWDLVKIGEQTAQLLTIFHDSLRLDETPQLETDPPPRTETPSGTGVGADQA